jgi:anti-sigma B factor antagonist
VEISARREGKITIFDISGHIDLGTSPELRKALLNEIQERRRARVVVNLTAVGYMDSSGLASLLEGLKASRDIGSRFVLFGLNTTLREVFHIAKLTKFFEICDDEEQAVASGPGRP